MSDAPRQPPPKKEVALALLEESSMFIHLDPRRPDVLVPKGFMGQPQLVLQVGLNMAIPIPDLEIDDVGISCTLSFNRSPFWCRIPWHAIYALVGEDGRGGVWPDDVPPEIQQQKPSGSAKAAPAKKQRPKLTSVASPKDAPAKDAPTNAGARDDADAATGDGAEVPAPNPSSPSQPGARADAPRVALAAVPRDAEEDGRPADDATPVSLGDTPKPPAPAPRPSSPEKEAQAARPAPAAKKQKREIPPYLRVIK